MIADLHMQQIGYASLTGPDGVWRDGILIRYSHWVDLSPWQSSRYIESDCLRLEIVGHPEHAKQSRYDPTSFYLPGVGEFRLLSMDGWG